MEKLNQQMKITQDTNKKSLVWDCGSTLYDSFELKSFERQLDSAIIHSRTMSMPHLPDRRVIVAAPPPTLPKKPSKLSRSLKKLLKSVFKFNKQTSYNSFFRLRDQRHHEYYVVYDNSGALQTIPEVPEIDFGGFSPEIKNSLVKRAASERFSATSIGISCA